MPLYIWNPHALSGTQSREVTLPPSPQAMGAESDPQFSIVVPVYNEEANLAELYARLRASLNAGQTYEIIFVDDGSRDGSRALIRDFHTQSPTVKLVGFSRNFGHQAAISAGLRHSRGDAVIVMDADLQDPPELIAALIEKWREGFKVVYAVRRRRKEGLVKRTAYFAFYRILRTFSQVELPADAGDFCLMDRIVVDQLLRLPERNLFLRGLRGWLGYSQVALPYERGARAGGEPQYTLAKLLKLAFDGIISMSSGPLRVASYLGFLTSTIGLAYFVYILVFYLRHGALLPGWTSVIGVVLLLGGAQLMLLGLLGEYVARIYDESKQRPLYVIAEVLL
jgi:polyisoprenyl-phosphate glycosyltransferase